MTEMDATQQHMDPDPDIDVHAVRVIVENPERDRAADYGTWESFIFVGTETDARQILPYNPKRKRATIACLPGFLTNNTLGYVSVAATRESVQAGGSKSGGLMVSGLTVVIESMQAVYAMPDGSHELTLLVIEERYA